MLASLSFASLVLVEIRDELGEFGPVVHDAEGQAIGIPHQEHRWFSLILLFTRHSTVVAALRQSGLLVGAVLLHRLEESLQVAFAPFPALPSFSLCLQCRGAGKVARTILGSASLAGLVRLGKVRF